MHNITSLIDKYKDNNNNGNIIVPKDKLTEFYSDCNDVISNTTLPEKTGGNGGKSLKNEDCFINIFNSNLDYKNKVLKELGVKIEDKYIALKPKKENNITIIQTEKWKEYKSGTKELSPTPKTDIIIRNIDTLEEIGISLKSGEGRATSADVFETNAI